MITEFQTAIATRLAADSIVSQAELVTEDSADLQTQVDAAINEQGMVVIIGQVSLTNINSGMSTGQKPAEMNCDMQLAVGEDPTVWRDDPLTLPTAKDVADAIAMSLQGYRINGFTPVVVESAQFVPDKKRQLYNLKISARAVLPINKN